MGVAFGIGFIAGPVIGGLLGEIGPRLPFVAAAGLSLVNCLFGIFVLPESLKPENRRPFSLRRANPIAAFVKAAKYPVVGSLIAIAILTNFAERGWRRRGCFIPPTAIIGGRSRSGSPSLSSVSWLPRCRAD